MASSPLVKLLMISGVFFSAAKMSAANDLFNPALLEIDHPVDVDISQFNRANSLPAGDYKVDIIVNGKRIEQRVVTFVQDNAEAEITPCFVDAKSVLASFGVKVEAVKALTEIDEKQCIRPAAVIEGATSTFNTDELALSLTIPQIYIDAAAHDAISPSRWNEGINALMVNYDFSGSETLRDDDGDDEAFYYLNLRNGINVGAWRLRNYSTLNISNGQSAYDSISTYAERNIAALRSQVMIGDTFTASDVFDSTQLRGVRLYTDNDMLPASQNGFAPVVRGVAKSNATVIVRQNGYVIYQSAVPPGAFSLTDLNTTTQAAIWMSPSKKRTAANNASRSPMRR